MATVSVVLCDGCRTREGVETSGKLGRDFCAHCALELLSRFVSKEQIDALMAEWKPEFHGQTAPVVTKAAAAAPAAPPAAPAAAADQKASERLQAAHKEDPGASIHYLTLPPVAKLPQKIRHGGAMWLVFEEAVPGNRFGNYLAKCLQ
jgi:hypothetical protein